MFVASEGGNIFRAHDKRTGQGLGQRYFTKITGRA